jgi:hypothetical protein
MKNEEHDHHDPDILPERPLFVEGRDEIPLGRRRREVADPGGEFSELDRRIGFVSIERRRRH